MTTPKLTAALLALAALTAAPSASASLDEPRCFATLMLGEVAIVQDTDPDDRWPAADHWTYHTRAYLGGHFGKHDNIRGFAGDSGHLEQVGAVLIDHKDVGQPGDSVPMRARMLAKERDDSSGRHGPPPRDHAEDGAHLEFVCEPSSRAFATQLPVPASPGSRDDETDGLVEFRWRLTFQVEA